MAGYFAIGDVVFSDLTKNEAAERIIASAKANKAELVVTPNATMLHRAFHDEAFLRLLQGATMKLADGVGVVYAAKALKVPIQNGKLAGVALGEALARHAEAAGVSLYLFGGKKTVADRAAENLKKAYPALVVAGCHDGYDFELESLLDEIGKSQAKIVYCCLGSPLQEEVGQVLSRRLSLPVLCLGGSLDVYAGDLSRAPRLFQSLSLEWLWRMMREPRRFSDISSLFFFLLDVRRLKKRKKSCNRAKKRL